MTSRWAEYGKPIRVEGGLKAQSARGAIGESWWSLRFLAVLESLALGSRLSRGRSYARAGQVLSIDVAPGLVSASVQGSRPQPYDVRIGLAVLTSKQWAQVEQALADQAIYCAQLLAGDMPTDIETVFTAAGTPLFPTNANQLAMQCSCPDWSVPCKHIAATFYLLAEAFDADPFQILRWRGRDRAELLGRLRELRGDEAQPAEPAVQSRPRPTGAAAVLSEITSPPLASVVDRFWVAPVPLPARPATLDTDVDLLLRQLPAPAPVLGGGELMASLREFYRAFAESAFAESAFAESAFADDRDAGLESSD